MGRTPPGDATRSARTENSPRPVDSHAGGEGPRPTARERREAQRYCVHGPASDEGGRGPCNTGRPRGRPATWARTLPCRRKSRSRRTTAEEMRPTGAGSGRQGRWPEDHPHETPAGHARRVESPGQTARTPSVFLLTVSRPVELSLQSSFQLSLTVLVDYRSRASI